MAIDWWNEAHSTLPSLSLFGRFLGELNDADDGRHILGFGGGAWAAGADAAHDGEVTASTASSHARPTLAVQPLNVAEVQMRRLLFCLLATIPLSGCFGPNATFSCGPELSSQRIDADAFRRPATTAGTGYLHC